MGMLVLVAVADAIDLFPDAEAKEKIKDAKKPKKPKHNF